MEALIMNWKPVDSWSGKRPSRVSALAPEAIEIDTSASDIAARIESMKPDAIYLLINLPDWIAMDEGRDVREFDPVTWRLLPLERRISLGYEFLDPRLKVVAGEKKLKSELELMRDKIIPTPAGWKIVEDPEADDGLAIIRMTEDELIENKVISLTEWIETACDKVDAEWKRRLAAGFTYTDGNTYPLDSEAFGAWSRSMDMIRLARPVNPYARTVDNQNIPFTEETFPMFYSTAIEKGDEKQRARSNAKDEIRRCNRFDETLVALNNYLGEA